MPARKKIDAAEIIGAVDSNASSKDLMARYNIRSLGHLKALYIDALVDQGRVKGITSGRKPRKTAPPGRFSRVIEVNNRGSLIIPKDVVEKFGLNVGDALMVLKTGVGISLRKE